MNNRIGSLTTLLASGLISIVAFQNCSDVSFEKAAVAAEVGAAGNGDPVVTTPPTNLPPVTVCEGVSCELTPLTKKPAVITALLAIGDHADDQLVIGGGSAQLVAETLVRYSSPVDNPKILAVLDHNNGGEDPEDGPYITDNLLTRYRVTVMKEPDTGLTDADVQGYDLIWFNNPGHPMGSIESRDVLMRFKGGVVMQGDDLAQGRNFSLEELTGLHYVDNGTSFTCGDTKYGADNNSGNQYAVTIDPAKLAGVNSPEMQFHYGNDIDLTTVARPDLEVLAWAKGSVEGCVDSRPAIVRYVR